MTTLSNILATSRAAHGLSLQDVADQGGLSKTHVWELEVGRVTNPSVKTISALAFALEISPIALFCAALDWTSSDWEPGDA